MIRGIHHAAVSTGNMERALTFYRDLLGFRVISDVSWPAGTEMIDRILGLTDSAGRVVTLRAGNAFLEIFQFASPEPRPGDPRRPVCDHGITHICVDVRDLDAEYQRLHAAGVTFHCPPQRFDTEFGEVKATYGRDFDGNVIELQQLPDKDPAALHFQ